MAEVLRGEIRWADLNPVIGHEQAGLRPVLVISNDIYNQRTRTVIALAITSQPPQMAFPLSLEIKSVNLPRRSWIKIDQVRALSTERIGRLMGKASPEELNQAIEGLNEIIGD